MSPSFARKALRFGMSYAEWICAGCPTRQPEEVQRLFEICISCDKFDPSLVTPFGTGGCQVCGCHISNEPSHIINKLVWPHESCPLGKWSAIIQPPPKDKDHV